MPFIVEDDLKIDATKLTIDEQLVLCRLLVKSGYVVNRQYRVKDKAGRVKTIINAGVRKECKDEKL